MFFHELIAFHILTNCDKLFAITAEKYLVSNVESYL